MSSGSRRSSEVPPGPRTMGVGSRAFIRTHDGGRAGRANLARPRAPGKSCPLPPELGDRHGALRGPDDRSVHHATVHDHDTPAALLERFHHAAGVRDFDDQLALLHRVLGDPDHGEAACRRIRSRFAVVLVDEFQDTDPKQWEILRRAFHGHTTLVLVGDPKQAIYAFRGAEVLSYLEAVAVADCHLELTTNWRSDGDLVQRLQVVLQGAALGNPDIVVHPVEAHHIGSRLSGAPSDEPFRLRIVRREPFRRRGTDPILIGDLRAHIPADMAADILQAWLATEFAAGRHARRVQKIADIEVRHAGDRAGEHA